MLLYTQVYTVKKAILDLSYTTDSTHTTASGGVGILRSTLCWGWSIQYIYCLGRNLEDFPQGCTKSINIDGLVRLVHLVRLVRLVRLQRITSVCTMSKL